MTEYLGKENCFCKSMEKRNGWGFRGCLGSDEPSGMWEVWLRMSPVLAEWTFSGR